MKHDLAVLLGAQTHPLQHHTGKALITEGSKTLLKSEQLLPLFRIKLAQILRNVLTVSQQIEFCVKIYEKRSVLKTEGHADGEQTLKLVMNSIYGKTVQDCSRFKNTSVYTNVNAFQKAQANPRMVDYDFFCLRRHFSWLRAHHRSKAQTPEQPHPDWMANARVSSADAHEVLL